MDALEAMKDKGNALFQQQRFTEAVQVYTSVLEKLRDSHVAAVRLEGAVRLNRAWAWIQMPGSESSESALVAAEQDCSAVIGNDPACVKAFYRRALARERRGHWKLAMEDAAVMKRLEPANPSVGPLLERLQQHCQDEEDLPQQLQQCTIKSDGIINTSTDTTIIALGEAAEDAWRALQTTEMRLKKMYQTSSMARRNPKRSQKEKKGSQCGLATKGEISHKTDDLWESLRREEITTVAKAFPRLKKGVTE